MIQSGMKRGLRETPRPVRGAAGRPGPPLTCRFSATSLSVAERLADFTTRLRFDDLPTEVVEHAKELLVYHLALAFTGTFTEGGAHAAQVAHELSAGAGRSTIVGHRERANPLDAVLAHAQFISETNGDDYSSRSGIHLGIVAHPVAWVMAESARASGTELITALVGGYEIACKLSEAAPRFKHYTRRSTNVFAPFGAAAVASRLLRYVPARTAAAYAQVAHMGMGVVEGTEYPYAFTHALLARNGLLGALIAREHTQGVGMRTIESENGMYAAFYNGEVPGDLDLRIGTLGKDFSILSSLTKHIAASGSYVLPLKVAKEALASAGGAPVASIVVSQNAGMQARSNYFEKRFDEAIAGTEYTGGSLRYQVADLLDATNPRSAMNRVKLEWVPAKSMNYAQAVVTSADGRIFSAQDDLLSEPKGDWGAWLRVDGVRLLGESAISRLLDLMRKLECVEDITEVMACLVPA